MGLVDWTSVSKNDKTGSGAKFIKLEAGRSFRIRPVFKPHVFYKYFLTRPQGGFGQAITDKPDDCIITKKYGEKPKQRFAVNVIDRSDGSLKILEGPITILKQFSAWAEETKTDPGSDKGGEFAIRVECPGGNKKNTKYHVSFINYSPFTDDEKTMIKESMYNLQEICKPTSQDKIEEKLYGSEEDSKSDSKKSSDSDSSKSQLSDDLDF